MKKVTAKLMSWKANAPILALGSLVLLIFGYDCLFFFYEPKRPEGLDDISVKDLLPKNVH